MTNTEDLSSFGENDSFEIYNKTNIFNCNNNSFNKNCNIENKSNLASKDDLSQILLDNQISNDSYYNYLNHYKISEDISFEDNSQQETSKIKPLNNNYIMAQNSLSNSTLNHETQNYFSNLNSSMLKPNTTNSNIYNYNQKNYEKPPFFIYNKNKNSKNNYKLNNKCSKKTDKNKIKRKINNKNEIKKGQTNPIKPENEIKIDLINLGIEKRTCVRLFPIPHKFSPFDIIRLLDKYLKTKPGNRIYSSIYVPLTKIIGKNIGFCFVNLVSPKYVVEFYKVFNGETFRNCKKPCSVIFSDKQNVDILNEEENPLRKPIFFTDIIKDN